jgi:hypothetical protein
MPTPLTPCGKHSTNKGCHRLIDGTDRPLIVVGRILADRVPERGVADGVGCGDSSGAWPVSSHGWHFSTTGSSLRAAMVSRVMQRARWTSQWSFCSSSESDPCEIRGTFIWRAFASPETPGSVRRPGHGRPDTVSVVYRECRATGRSARASNRVSKRPVRPRRSEDGPCAASWGPGSNSAF